ncbi:hypothetical protein SV7mr_51760 [Stieleria bergensis]|uniref:DUF502 domain-containing protein n=1 Tax=Stieleria bergensis TaxID=2528025 RepID=A0A517T2P3_9BACT|nr:MAG: hypothetical protein CBB71_18595 [Rhodopirellula sp. TMED11]QDT62626.1 hypothetical protein SV7mr_51760 [Planctomycetes bacterium SV_7m_r]
MNQRTNPIRFLRTTAIGGLLFLLPLIVIGALIGQIVPIVMSLATTLGELLPGFVKTPSGIALLFALSIALLLLLCFAAGLLARWSFSRNVSAIFEKKLAMFFPRYTIIKDLMADSIGGDHAKAQMKPVVVRFDECLRLGFETERDDEAGVVAVYLPGSPDPWSGKVAVLKADRVEPLDVDFGDAVATCEQVGRGSTALIGHLKH